MGSSGFRPVIELIDGIERWNKRSFEGRQKSNLMSKGIASSLEKEIENGIPSALEDLGLDMGTTNKGAVPKDEDTHLTHSGKKRK